MARAGLIALAAAIVWPALAAGEPPAPPAPPAPAAPLAPDARADHFQNSLETARRQLETGERAAAAARAADLIEEARTAASPLRARINLVSAEILILGGDAAGAAAAIMEAIAIAPQEVRPYYGTLFVALSEAQDVVEAGGDMTGAAALVDARVAILRTFLPQGEADDAVQTLLFQKFFLLHSAGALGEAADALAAWASAAPADAQEREFIAEMADLQLTATELSSYTAARDTQLGEAELAVAFANLLTDPQGPRKAAALRARAAAETGLGLHERAAQTLLEAAQILERTPSADARRGLALVVEDMAANAFQRGRLTGAAALYARAEAINADAVANGAEPLGDLDESILALNRARLEIDRDRPQDALRFVDRARRHFESAQRRPLKWNEQQEASRIELTRALALANLGEEDAARIAIQTAIAAGREALPENHPDLALLLGNASDLLFTLDRTEEAWPLLREAVAINEAALPPTLPQRVELERKVGLSHLAAGRLVEAAKVMGTIATARKDPAYRSALREAVPDFELLAHTLFALKEPEGAIEALQFTKVTRSAEALAQLSARLALQDGAAAVLMRERQDLLEAHRRTTSELLAAFGSGDGAPDLARRQRLSQSLGALGKELAATDDALAVEGLDAPGIGAVTALTLSEIRALLREDEALVTFLLPGLDPERVAGLEGSANKVIAITRAGLAIAPVPERSRRRLRARIAAFRCEMAASDPGCRGAREGTRGAMLDADPAEALGFDTAVAHALYSDLFGGIDAVIAGKASLILVPPPDLLHLPFSALVTEAAPPASLADAAFMIRRQAISVLPSIASLVALRQRTDPGALVPYLGVGDPVIGGEHAPADCDALDALALRSAAPSETVMSAAPSGLGLADVAALSALPRLADATCEVLAIAETMGGPSRLLLGADATESAIKAMNDSGELERYRTLVFATHGLVSGEAGASGPGLVLSPPAVPTLRDDGLLTSAEIAMLRLDAELVVLSACNTAAGEAGDTDGFSGLSRAFFHAGARALLVTHWAVYSEAAVMISTGTLGRLSQNEGLGQAEALRQATLAILDTPGQTPARLDPSFWAAFTIVGAG